MPLEQNPTVAQPQHNAGIEASRPSADERAAADQKKLGATDRVKQSAEGACRQVADMGERNGAAAAETTAVVAHDAKNAVIPHGRRDAPLGKEGTMDKATRKLETATADFCEKVEETAYQVHAAIKPQKPMHEKQQ